MAYLAKNNMNKRVELHHKYITDKYEKFENKYAFILIQNFQRSLYNYNNLNKIFIDFLNTSSASILNLNKNKINKNTIKKLLFKVISTTYDELITSSQPIRKYEFVDTEQKYKKPLKSYFVFCTIHKQEFSEKYPNLNSNQVTSKLAEAWRNLSAKQKAKYIDTTVYVDKKQ
jgi:hypothetical protein